MRIPRPSCTTTHALARVLPRSRTRAAPWFAALSLTVSCAPSDFDERAERPVASTADAESACATSDAPLDASGCPMPDAGSAAGPVTDTETTARDAQGATPPGSADVGPSGPNEDAAQAGADRDAASAGQRPDGASQTQGDGQVPEPARDASAADASGPTLPVVCGGQPLACGPGAIDNGKQACTVCGAGEQTRTRKCSADGCSWGAWSAWSVCSAAGPTCTPGKVELATQECGACNSGKQTRTRTCSADGCGFGAWSAWSACAGQTAACTPGATTACSPADSCGQRVCSNSCTWGGCQPKQPAGCLRRRGGTQEEGSNYRCCGGSKWQFCLPSCSWSDSCVSCSQGAPDYCADC